MNAVLADDEKDFVTGLTEILQDLGIEANTDETERGIIFHSK
jgi:hypothetical protein